MALMERVGRPLLSESCRLVQGNKQVRTEKHSVAGGRKRKVSRTAREISVNFLKVSLKANLGGTAEVSFVPLFWDGRLYFFAFTPQNR